MEFVTPAGNSISFTDQGADDTVDSDIDQITGRVTLIVETTDVENVDAGYVTGEPGEITGVTWIDDFDGILEAGETPEAGVTVSLLDNAGNVLVSTTTDTDGAYTFTNVPPGNYQVEFGTVADHDLTLQDQGTDDTIDSDPNQTTRRAAVTLASGDTEAADAGYVELASIAGLAWIDDFDGIRETGETLEAGVTVRLRDAGGNVVATAFTGAGGDYLFAGLFPGTYEVEFVSPTGHLITLQDEGADGTVDSDIDRTQGRATVNLAPGDDYVALDAGFIADTSISGVAWNDDGDGIREAGETLEAGITVNLLDDNGTIVATKTTGTNGDFLFDGLYPGDYTVQFITPTGDSVTFTDQGTDDTVDSDIDRTTGEVQVTTIIGTETTNVDAGYVSGAPASISGTAWGDSDSDGEWETGDPTKTGVPVDLVDANGNVVATTTTAANGTYSFIDVPPGDYTLRFGTPSGESITLQNQGTDDTNDSDIDRATGEVAITVAGVDLVIDAGYVTGDPGEVTGVVWTDNGDGIRDAVEPLHSGVTVNLIGSNGQVIDTMSTNVDGEFAFTELPPGDYEIEIVTPIDHATTLQDEGADEDADSDIGQTSGRTAVTLPSGGSEKVDGGVVQEATIAGIAWTDDGDGIRQPVEPVNAGVTVNLVDMTGAVIDTVVTGIDGRYEFTGVFPGDYEVEFVTPADHAITFTDQGADDTVDSDIDRATGRTPVSVEAGDSIDNIDGGFLTGTLGAIEGVSWTDGGNGINEPGEPIIEGVIVTLYAENGAALATTTTGPTGEYAFPSLPNGNYVVEFTKPLGFIATLQNQGTDDTKDSDIDPVTGQTPVSISNGNTAEASAGYVETSGPASVSGILWEDENSNGTQDPSEVGIPGETIELLDQDGNVIATTTTDNQGRYTFNNLPPGTFFVQFPPPVDISYTWTDAGDDDSIDSDVDRATGRSAPVTAVAGENSAIDAGISKAGPPGTITGTTFIDPNVDGIQNGSENTSPNGTVVNLIDPTTGQVVASTEPGDNPATPGIETGWYEFASVPPGLYAVEFVDPNGLIISPQSEPNSPDPTTGLSPTFTLDPQGTVEVNAGFSLPVSIEGIVWFDANRNAVQDTGEVGVEGITIYLVPDGSTVEQDEAERVSLSQTSLAAPSGQVIATQVTDENGAYLFDGLWAGDYQVVFDLDDIPFGTWRVFQHAVSNTVIDSDANIDGLTPTIETEPGDHIPNIDMGIATNSTAVSSAIVGGGTVSGDGAGDGTVSGGANDGAVANTPPSGPLAFTGVDTPTTATIAVLLLMLGLLLLFFSRREGLENE